MSASEPPLVADLDDRMRRVELKMMDLEVSLDQLNTVVTRQDGALLRVEQQLDALHKRLRQIVPEADA